MELRGQLIAGASAAGLAGYTVTLTYQADNGGDQARALGAARTAAKVAADGDFTVDVADLAVTLGARTTVLAIFTANDPRGAVAGAHRLPMAELTPIIRQRGVVKILLEELRDPTPAPAPTPRPTPAPNPTPTPAPTPGPSPSPTVDPTRLRGRIEGASGAAPDAQFAGYRVTATYRLREGADGSVVDAIEDGDRFALDLPGRAMLEDDRVVLVARFPDGSVAGETRVAPTDLGEEAVIRVAAWTPAALTVDARAELARPERIKGKVIRLDGEAVRGRQVVFWASNGDTAPQVVLVTQTDQLGGFAADRPKGRYRAMIATVSGTANAQPDKAVAVALDSGREGLEGGLPSFVYLVVEGEGEAAAIDEHDCQCKDGAAPRLPDQADLVGGDGSYSQDIGGGCMNFTVPNRTLEEFSYSMAVRTSEPLVKGTTVSNIEHRDAAVFGTTPFLLSLFDDDKSSESEKKAGASNVFRYVPLATTGSNPLLTNYQRYGGRGVLNAGNAVDWDSDPTFYQATTIAHGHILHFRQVWKADGYSLGDLLYSLPLAPGQKKQIVVFDWDRTEYGRRDESAHEDEALDAYLGHDRDILDITQGAVSEQMRGGSRAHTSGSAGGIGGGLIANVGAFLGIAGGYSASSGSSSASAWQNSSRNTSATGLNQLRDHITQRASAVRNQRSTVVQTARQAEQFRVESEVVANHNHCHAITIQYFEVLRHYVIEQKLSHVQECLFVPLLMAPFDERKVVRWLDILRGSLHQADRRAVFRLATGGVAYRRKTLMDAFDALERRIADPLHGQQPAGSYAQEPVLDLSGELYIELELNRPADKAGDAAEADQLLDELSWNPFLGLLSFGFQELRTRLEKRVRAERDRIFQEDIAPEIAKNFVSRLKFAAIDREGARHDLDLDATLVNRYARSQSLFISIRPKMGELPVTREQIAKFVIFSTIDLDQAARSRVMVRRATISYRTAHYDGVLIRNDAINNDLKSAVLIFGAQIIPADNVVLYTPLNTEEMRNPRKEDEELVQRLLTHLNANLEYYHRAIWMRMDPQRRFMLLDGFIAPHARGRSVASVVENRVIGIAGNSLILPVAPGYKLDPSYQTEPELDADGKPMLDEMGFPVMLPGDLLAHYEPVTPIPPYRVSVPTRGVFAEAVMGACNSCEKKDESRFWRWEESPNPDEPTPISPVETAAPQRSDPGQLAPSGWPAPIVAFQNAPAAPEPGATLASTLSLLGQGSLFPDITGLSETQKSALQAMLSNQDSAKHYADKAAELATMAAAQRSGGSMVDSIKKSMDDGTIDKDTGKKLIEDVYRAQINGRTSPDPAPATASGSKLADAGAGAVAAGREVEVQTTHADGTQTLVKQKAADVDAYTPVASDNYVLFWQQLLNFQPPPFVIDSLKAKSIYVLPIEKGSGTTVNMDLYRIFVTKPPVINGEILSAEQTLSYFRLHLDDFMDRSAVIRFRAEYNQPGKEDPDELSSWRRDAPGARTAVMVFDVNLGYGLPPDAAGVVCGDHSTSSWIFSTVHTPRDWDHPVSGNREFGISFPAEGSDDFKTAPTGFYIYTKGVDRPTSIAEGILESKVFDGGDRCWKGCMTKLLAFLQNNQGAGEIKSPYIYRPQWQLVRLYLASETRPA